jgi:hypothetical protein
MIDRLFCEIIIIHAEISIQRVQIPNKFSKTKTPDGGPGVL